MIYIFKKLNKKAMNLAGLKC